MSNEVYKVYLVVDATFGERLASLPTGRPVWIVDSITNTPVIRRLWDERPEATHLTGITSFVGTGSPADDVLNRLDDIDLHHGKHSADAPYGELENRVGCFLRGCPAPTGTGLPPERRHGGGLHGGERRVAS